MEELQHVIFDVIYTIFVIHKKVRKTMFVSATDTFTLILFKGYVFFTKIVTRVKMEH